MSMVEPPPLRCPAPCARSMAPLGSSAAVKYPRGEPKAGGRQPPYPARAAHDQPGDLSKRPDTARETSAETDGLRRARNGRGRQTSMAATPTRAVSAPLISPSPKRRESFDRRPPPATDPSMSSPTATAPVATRWEKTARVSRHEPIVPPRPP